MIPFILCPEPPEVGPARGGTYPRWDLLEVAPARGGTCMRWELRKDRESSYLFSLGVPLEEPRGAWETPMAVVALCPKKQEASLSGNVG